MRDLTARESVAPRRKGKLGKACHASSSFHALFDDLKRDSSSFRYCLVNGLTGDGWPWDCPYWKNNVLPNSSSSMTVAGVAWGISRASTAKPQRAFREWRGKLWDLNWISFILLEASPLSVRSTRQIQIQIKRVYRDVIIWIHRLLSIIFPAQSRFLRHILESQL